MEGLEIPEPSPDAAPPLAEWTLQVEMLASLYDAVTALTGFLVKVNGGKGREPKPLPRPITALDRARERRKEEAADFIISTFAPHALR